MKAEVDGALCQGFGTCAAIAPDLFQLDELGYASTAGDGTVPEGQEDLAESAALECPMSAISLTR
jgi:ferredoxin